MPEVRPPRRLDPGRPGRVVVAVVCAAALLTPTLTAAPLRPGTRVLIVGADGSDARIALTHEAIEFWNRTFADLDLEPVLVDAEVVLASPVTRVLENYAWQISRRAGRHSAGPSEPDPPAELTDLEVDVVVLLSAQDLMPFAWPMPETSRYFVAINTDPDLPSGSNATRNVVAHELGHVVGLVHQDNPEVLMCLPCRPPAPEGEEAAFRPLTPQDRSRLVELYR